MTIRHLRILMAVADTGQMSAAARQLYITQPTVSQAIADIEAAYGVRIFERLSRRLYITPGRGADAGLCPPHRRVVR